MTNPDFLHKKSKPVTEYDARLHMLLDDMRETMVSANGIGIAAPQVGVLWRACLVTDAGEIIEMINPEIIASKKPSPGEEMCMSVSDESIEIIRHQRITVRAQDRRGNTFERNLRDMGAIVAQHEIDHLNGVLITDYEEDIQWD